MELIFYLIHASFNCAQETTNNGILLPSGVLPEGMDTSIGIGFNPLFYVTLIQSTPCPEYPGNENCRYPKTNLDPTKGPTWSCQRGNYCLHKNHTAKCNPGFYCQTMPHRQYIAHEVIIAQKMPHHCVFAQRIIFVRSDQLHLRDAITWLTVQKGLMKLLNGSLDLLSLLFRSSFICYSL